MLYGQGLKEQPRVVIPATLVRTLLACYHELPLTVHQGVSRTVEFLNKKVLVGNHEEGCSRVFRKCDACAKRQTGHSVSAPSGEALVSHEFLDVVSLVFV